ncbi:hypothetical protein ZIOFF_062008 [Zingiber officinale]|uniref:Retrovirus-related Pol polyprotein from transposon TNT 1-94 n=1 Tax=Zingiber officinale TaxID=94328 RepID=A0A8J5EZU7_ZINOF|nr:hypothetical protein ZIOFF_062008 [Zingiber officinale]
MGVQVAGTWSASTTSSQAAVFAAVVSTVVSGKRKGIVGCTFLGAGESARLLRTRSMEVGGGRGRHPLGHGYCTKAFKIRYSHSIFTELQFMQNPMKHHLGVAKRILLYVAGTVDFEIYYTKVSKFNLYGFTDSDWANSMDDRKSTSASVFNIGSGEISWSSKK